MHMEDTRFPLPTPLATCIPKNVFWPAFVLCIIVNDLRLTGTGTNYSSTGWHPVMCIKHSKSTFLSYLSLKRLMQ